MKLTIDVPDSIQESLHLAAHDDLASAAKQAMAITWYRNEKLSIGQVAEFLGTSVPEAEGLMKAQGIDATFSLDDLIHDRETLNRLLDN